MKKYYYKIQILKMIKDFVVLAEEDDRVPKLIRLVARSCTKSKNKHVVKITYQRDGASMRKLVDNSIL